MLSQMSRQTNGHSCYHLKTQSWLQTKLTSLDSVCSHSTQTQLFLLFSANKREVEHQSEASPVQNTKSEKNAVNSSSSHFYSLQLWSKAEINILVFLLSTKAVRNEPYIMKSPIFILFFFLVSCHKCLVSIDCGGLLCLHSMCYFLGNFLLGVPLMKVFLASLLTKELFMVWRNC